MHKILSLFIAIFTLTTFNYALSKGKDAIEDNQNEEQLEVDPEEIKGEKKRARDFKQEKGKKSEKKRQKLNPLQNLNFDFPKEQEAYGDYISKKLKFLDHLPNADLFFRRFKQLCEDLLLDPVDIKQALENAECFDENVPKDLLDLMALLQKIIKTSTFPEKAMQPIRLRPVINIFGSVVENLDETFSKKPNVNNIGLFKQFILCYLKLSSSIRSNLIELLKPTALNKDAQISDKCIIYLFYIFKEYVRDLDEKGQYKLDEILKHMSKEPKKTKIPMESITGNNFALFIKFLLFIQKIEKSNIDDNNELNLILCKFFKKNQSFEEIRELCYEIVEGENVFFTSLHEYDFPSFIRYMLHMMRQSEFKHLNDVNNVIFFTHKLMGCATDNIKVELLNLMAGNPSYDKVIRFLTYKFNPRDIFRDENYIVPPEASICFRALKDYKIPGDDDGLKYLSSVYEDKLYMIPCSKDHDDKRKEFLDVLSAMRTEAAFFKQRGYNIAKNVGPKPFISDLIYEAYKNEVKPETAKKIFDFFGISFAEGYHYELAKMKDEYKAKYIPKEVEERQRRIQAQQMILVERAPQQQPLPTATIEKEELNKFMMSYNKLETNEEKRIFVLAKIPELCRGFLLDNEQQHNWLYDIENAEDVAKDDECVKKIKFIISEIKDNKTIKNLPGSQNAYLYLNQIWYFARFNIAISYQMFYTHRTSSDILYALGLGNMICHPEQSDASLEQRARIFILRVASVCDGLLEIKETRAYKTLLKEFIAVLGNDTLCMEGKLKDVDTWYDANVLRIKNAKSLTELLKEQESFNEEASVLILKTYHSLLNEFLAEDPVNQVLNKFIENIQGQNLTNLDYLKMQIITHSREKGKSETVSRTSNFGSFEIGIKQVFQFISDGFESLRAKKENKILPEIYNTLKEVFVGKKDKDDLIITEELIKSILTDVLVLDLSEFDIPK
ncbi:MAG: hypothetical protein Q8S31_06280 [Alphaproteobacteria bacterium]|nr:hypothetical protein [Alphaproteobacteria bacterium]